MPTHVSCTALAAAFSVLSAGVAAQDLAPARDSSVRRLPAATVTATADPLPRPLIATPASVSRLDARALTARDLALTPAAALSRVPGVTVQEGALNTQRVVLRGQGARASFTSNRVRAYLGAIPLTDGEGATDLEDVDLALLDGIDVVRGPATTSYGAGLGGVLLLRPAFAPPQAGLSTEVDALAGGLGTYRLGARVAVADREHGRDVRSLRVGYRRTQSAGFRQNARYRRDNLTALARLGSRGGGGGGVTELQALWTGVRGEIPSALSAEALAEDPTQAGGTWGPARGYEAYDRLALGLAHRQRLRRGWRLAGSTFLSHRLADEPRPFDILAERSLLAGGRAVLRYGRRGAAVRAALGTELLREWRDWSTAVNRFREFPAGTGSVRGGLLTADREARHNLDVFAHADWRLWRAASPHPATGFRRALTLTTGLALNQTRYRITDLAPLDADGDHSGRYAFAAQLSPRAALLYRAAPAWSVFAQAARGFSPPTVAETLTPDGRPNPDIRPETGWTYELGARARPADGSWRLEAVVYALLARDLLVARRLAEDRLTGVNAGRTRHLGVELAGETAIAGPLSAYASYTLQAHRFVDFVDGEADYSGNALTGVPRHQAAGGLTLSVPRLGARGQQRLYAHAGLRTRGRLPVDDAGSAFAEGWTVVDAQARWCPGLGGLELRAGVDNALDADYVAQVNVNAGSFGGRAPRYFYPGRPRVFWVGLAWGGPGRTNPAP